MGKGSNPMQEHHRQKRQKEIQRNKQQRIKARDERVVQTKTVASVQEEIRNLKRRKNLQPTEQQKLQRLEKELKLVKAAAAASNQNKNNAQQQSQRQVSQQAAQHELDDPRKSVYYDEKFNPFGAPPPGKPRLYHQRGGGVTMNIKLAAVPGEEPPLRTIPPPPPRAQQPRRDESRADSRSTSRNHQPLQSHTHQLSMSPPKMEEASEDEELIVQEQKEAINGDKPEKKPLALPHLPAPSKSVMRSRRGKALVDIWASTEEVEYERVANKVDLEADDIGATAPPKLKKKKKSKLKKPPLEIYYQDRSGQTQGPFPKAQIQGWLAAGYFPPSTLAKTNRNPKWLPMGEIPALQPETPKNREVEEEQQQQSLADRILALKENRNSDKGENSVEDRISALKQGRTSVEDRIAALKKSSEVEERMEEGISSEDLELEASTTVKQQATVPPPPPPPHTQTVESATPYHVEEDLQESEVYAVASNAPPYPISDDMLRYRDEDEGEVAPQPSYPIDEADEIPAYPQPGPDGNDHGIPVYPIGDDDVAVAPYPVDEEVQGIPYPSDTAYPVDDETAAYPVTDSYPVIDSYPTVDDIHDAEHASVPQAGATSPNGANLKKVNVDKDVVAFLPSHLRNRKRKRPLQGKMELKRKNENEKSDDDYAKLMKEVDGIN